MKGLSHLLEARLQTKQPVCEARDELVKDGAKPSIGQICSFSPGSIEPMGSSSLIGEEKFLWWIRIAEKTQILLLDEEKTLTLTVLPHIDLEVFPWTRTKPFSSRMSALI